MNPSNIYPRTGDTQTVYLNQVVTDPSILVSAHPGGVLQKQSHVPHYRASRHHAVVPLL